ncbi:hypothetical protein GCM10010260_39380 [Streptomyces filipinensis]|uniref:Uncharacterized protein n=1 Tax=Streptomyces filipinensis TaxID=66887 RepID=A0A918MBD1_9ACTN|nr:hypothetical protein GCM10010260_39380 [Streptomyces filipinensis]
MSERTFPAASSSAEASASGTPGAERQPSSTRRAAVGTGVFAPFDIDMSAPIRVGLRAPPAVPDHPCPHNLFPGPGNSQDRRSEIAGQLAVTPQELALYRI